MPSKDTETVAARLPRNVVKLVREAAKDDGVSVSTWVGRRVNNTLRRTGRLRTQDTRPTQQDTRLAATE